LSSLFDAGGAQASRATQTLKSVQLPTEDQLRIQLQQFVQQGQLSPMQAQTILQQETAYKQIEEDPRLRADQVDVLSALDNQIREGGLDAQARADIFNTEQDLGTQARGAREAIQAQARARGIGNSDLALTQQAIADQGAANRGAAIGVNVAALAEERRAQAQRDKAALAANLRSADYQKAASEAAAQDAINRFNATNRQDVINRNVQAENIARATNQSEKQRIADTNVGLGNQQEQYNKNIPLSLADLRLRKAGSVAQAYGAEGAADAARDDRLLKLIGNGASAAAMAFSDEDAKTDMEPIDSGSVLEKLSGVKFKYRDPDKHGKGERMGILAQDIAKVQPSAVVEDADGTKMVDFGQLMNFVLGNMVDVHDRLKEVERR
jgi:hypothetical protein